MSEKYRLCNGNLRLMRAGSSDDKRYVTEAVRCDDYREGGERLRARDDDVIVTRIGPVFDQRRDHSDESNWCPDCENKRAGSVIEHVPSSVVAWRCQRCGYEADVCAYQRPSPMSTLLSASIRSIRRHSVISSDAHLSNWSAMPERYGGRTDDPSRLLPV